jgi:STE24 endopeptidase
MARTIFYIILLIIIADFLFERFLDYLNTTSWSNQLPEVLKGIYNEKEYLKSQDYKKTNHQFGMLTSSFSFLLILMMILLGGFAWLDQCVAGFTTNIILSALIFFGVLGLASDLLTTPFSIYDTFVIEEKFGFNKTTPATFLLDKVKGWLLSALLGGGVLALIIYLWTITGSYFWMIAWGVITLITVFITMFYSNLIVPLFNKQTPLEEGELKQAIYDFSNKAGFQLNHIYVIDGSKRSNKANAYFTGIGPKKRIVLYDTLIKDLTTDQIVAVLAHEIGHYKKKHVLTGLLLGVLQTGVMLYLLQLLVASPLLSQALGVHDAKFHMGLIAFGILYTPFSFFIGIGMNILSRKNEYEADAFASGLGLSESLGEALKKLSVKSLSNLTPNSWYVFFHYSHPTLLQRLDKLNQ